MRALNVKEQMERIHAMKLSKNGNMSKQTMLLAHGSRDTCIHDESANYLGITLKEIADMVKTPQATEKADAAFVIASTYRKHDGRNHAAQRECGEYWMLAIDVDEGDVIFSALLNAVTELLMDATTLIYSSSGASEENKKWRVLIPLAEPLSGQDYVDAQLALFEIMLREYNITCDGALARTGQPIYLPNVPPAKRGDEGEPLFYKSNLSRGDGMLIAKSGKIWATVEFNRKNAEIAEQRAELDRQRRVKQREEKRAQYPTSDDPVDEFNGNHTIADLFIQHGYEKQGGSDSYKSPHSTTGSFATKDFGTHWVSLSGSDLAAGIGTSSGHFCWGDAFDLYVHFEHGGDFTKAVRTYGAELRPSTNETRDAIVSAAMQPKPSDNLDDFDIIPDVKAGPSTIIIPNEDKKPIFWARDAMPVLKSSYLIKNWIGRAQMSVVYGQSNVGKSFFCLDIAFCLAAGVEWQGYKVRKSPVLYLATEGGNAFHNRVVALRKEYELDDVPLAVRPSPIDLLHPEADLAQLIELCQSIEAELGEPLGIIVVDTLSRAMAGGDENGAVDMTAVIANCDALREATGAHIMIVHHSGKNVANGARGHSSLRAATDTEIELEVDGDLRTATATKQRDLEPQAPIVFTLKVHSVGIDEDGDDVTTCTILAADEDAINDMNIKRPTGANQKVIVGAFKQLRGEGAGHGNTGGAGWPEPNTYWVMDESDLRRFAMGKMSSTNPSSAYATAIKALLGGGYMVQNEGYIWICAKEGKVK